MKFLSFLKVTLFASLLLFLGAVVEQRYDLLERLPIRLVSQKSANGEMNGQNIAELLRTEVPSNHSSVDFGIFWQAWDILEEEFHEPEKIVPVKMVDGAVGGMVASLGDPYTTYLPPEDKVRSGQDLAGAFFGVGIELGYIDGILAVVSPLDGSPAAKAGVQAGDLIIQVKDQAKEVDESTSGWSLTKAVDTIRGAKGTPVVLTLVRKSTSNEPFEVSLIRDEIIVKSVELKFVEYAGKRVAHVKLSRFGERTQNEWLSAIEQIQKERKNIKGIVLDLRNDPGGFFDEAINIASDFIPSGVVVSQKGRFSSKEYSSNGSARLKDIPLVLLVNGGSASASEIVAGALRDRLGTKLVGQKTFGKGTVQDRRELKNGGGLHVTIARWMLPGGQWIHEQGIPVDVTIADDPKTTIDEMLNKAIESL
ncbi:S41 family peptidase [Candidatus Woesebacteria bacterium]|nr:S41 family peptidase [Candidatus Woesebacteria bacterium]